MGVDESDYEAPPDRVTVRGVLRGVDGSPLAGIEMRVLARDLHGEEKLAGGQAMLDGRFDFQISGTALATDGVRRALVVEALGEREEVIAAVESLDVPDVLEAELVAGGIHGATPQLDRLRARLEPALGELRTAELNTHEVAFAARALREDAASVERLTAAERLATDMSWPVELAYAVRAAALPVDRDALLALPDEDIAQALRDAGDAGAIAVHAVPVDDVPDLLRTARVDALLRQPSGRRPCRGVGSGRSGG